MSIDACKPHSTNEVNGRVRPLDLSQRKTKICDVHDVPRPVSTHEEVLGFDVAAQYVTRMKDV